MKLPVDPRLPLVSFDQQYLRQLNTRLYELLRDTAKANNLLADGFLFSVVSVSANYAVTTEDQFIFVSATATVTLPAATETKTKRFVVKNTGVGTVTVDTVSGNIDGASTSVLAANVARDIVSDGSNYWIV